MSDKFSFSKSFSYREQVSRSISWGHHFLFLNLLLSIAIGGAYVYASPSADSFMAFAYLILSWIGHMSFLTFICYLIVFFPLSFIGNFRWYRVLSVVLAVCGYTILLFDIKLYMAVKIHLSLTALNLMISSLDFNTGLNYNFLLIAIPLVLLLELLFAKVTTHSLYRGHHSILVKSFAAVIIAAFISSHCIHIWADATSYD